MAFVVMIQCALTMQRCSGYMCSKAFYEKTGKFENYPESQYLAFSCGGCNGKGISAELQHLEKVFKKDQIDKSSVIVHFATCITHDNTHHDRCPNLGIMKKIVAKRGFENVVDGTEINPLAESRRRAGIYKIYE